MSCLGGRLAAGREAAYFVEESKQAVSRLLEKKPSPLASTKTPTSGDESRADVLPEILRHSLPPQLLRKQPLSEYSSPVSTPSKWSINDEKTKERRFSGASADVMNPLRGYLSLPQVTFGPKRWQLPEINDSITASTANELRHHQNNPLTSEKIKAAAQGLQHVGKAFAVGTAVIFGGGALTFGVAASTLNVHSARDIRIKGRDLVQPKVQSLQEQLIPLRNWVNEVSRKWQLQMKHDIKEKPLVKELSKRFRAKGSD